MTENPSFITTCTEDENGNVILDIPEELLEAMGWGEGTILDISALPGRLILHEVPPESDSSSGGTDS
jgi:hypothetical protein